MHGWSKTVADVVGAGDFTDPTNSRVIYLAVAGLVLLGSAVLCGAIMWWRATRVEHPALGPLEEMSTRAWWKGDFVERRRRLERIRQHAAGATGDALPAPDPVDLEALVKSTPTSFDDLLDGFDLSAAAEPDPAVDATDAEPIPGAIDPLLRLDPAE